MISVLLTLPLSLALQTSSDDVKLPWDTAYIDQQTYIENLADTVQASERTFQGPGPILVHFEAEVDPDVTTYVSWDIAEDQQFQSLIVSFHETDIDYTFDETGTYYARFSTSNADNTEETESEIYTIRVTESLLQIPNLITPDSPSGNNRVFKVKYQSLAKFEMWVYNRWGQQLYHTTDPSDGWDGTQGGRVVPTGAYYYLIKALGTDGIHYQRRGDINVLRLKKVDSNSPTP
ncbi:MAG: gliding motility-associated C-terminal domain-containing protein [Bacteroidales bacterium]|nr:gliding motility-associated C-terminal domain-containing protein [Candidatus Liminaster caballi]